MEKKVEFAIWVIPVTKEPWHKGCFGMCTKCKYVNQHTDIAPNYCERCGAFMLNKCMK